MFQRNYARYYDLFNNQKPYEKEIKFVHRWAERPKSIFDIGCGTGIYWQYFPKGTTILGIDRSQEMADENRQGIVMHGDITKFKTRKRFECATALFDVLNYIPRHDWWKNIPISKGSYFIFDIWDTKKIERAGFEETVRTIGGTCRHIKPIKQTAKSVDLKIDVYDKGAIFSEVHRMYLHSHEDILKFCGKEFEVMMLKRTDTWQTWYKLRRK